MMWDAEWMHGTAWACGPDGRALIVVCPNGREWHIDGRASNCTLPNDLDHKCWVRHGTAPNLTVDKAGRTCAGRRRQHPGRRPYHGFLRSGTLTAG
jgi:hypothetical protein